MRQWFSCALNPACGREVRYEIKKAALKKKVLVVGGGIGGKEDGIVIVE